METPLKTNPAFMELRVLPRRPTIQIQDEPVTWADALGNLWLFGGYGYGLGSPVPGRFVGNTI